MVQSGGQEFLEEQNELWVDLHTCSTGYARAVFEEKLKEAYKYGLSSVEVIYGTPDAYQGSIKAAIDEIIDRGHDLIKKAELIHAGVTVTLKNNPRPEPRDEDMCFSAIEPEYDGSAWRAHEYRFPLYPYRKVYNSGEVAEYFGASVELVRAIAQGNYEGEEIPEAELRTVYDEDWKKNITTWYFTGRSLDKFVEIWQDIRDPFVVVLKDAGAAQDEIAGVGSVVANGQKPTLRI